MSANAPNVITGTIIQQSPYQPYTAGTCNIRTCSPLTHQGSCGNDWTTGMTMCAGGRCPPLLNCSKVNPKVCPQLGGRPALNANFTTAPIVQCSYNPNQVILINDVLQWLATFGPNLSFNNVIAPSFCTQNTTETGVCPPDPATGLVPTVCSRLISTGIEGDICRQWEYNMSTSNNAPSATATSPSITYCSQNINSPNCSCMNRALDPVFQELQQYTTASPSCWYKPCINIQGQLVPPQLQNVVCPVDVCDSIRSGYQPTSLADYTAAQSKTICLLQKPSTSSSNTATIWITIFWIILILLAIVVIVFAIFEFMK